MLEEVGAVSVSIAVRDGVSPVLRLGKWSIHERHYWCTCRKTVATIWYASTGGGCLESACDWAPTEQLRQKTNE